MNMELHSHVTEVALCMSETTGDRWSVSGELPCFAVTRDSDALTFNVSRLGLIHWRVDDQRQAVGDELAGTKVVYGVRTAPHEAAAKVLGVLLTDETVAKHTVWAKRKARRDAATAAAVATTERLLDAYPHLSADAAKPGEFDGLFNGSVRVAGFAHGDHVDLSLRNLTAPDAVAVLELLTTLTNDDDEE